MKIINIFNKILIIVLIFVILVITFKNSFVVLAETAEDAKILEENTSLILNTVLAPVKLVYEIIIFVNKGIQNECYRLAEFVDNIGSTSDSSDSSSSESSSESSSTLIESLSQPINHVFEYLKIYSITELQEPLRIYLINIANNIEVYPLETSLDLNVNPVLYEHLDHILRHTNNSDVKQLYIQININNVLDKYLEEGVFIQLGSNDYNTIVSSIQNAINSKYP